MEEKSTIVIVPDAGIYIRSVNDILDLFGSFYGATGFLFTENDFSPEFFDLRSRLAGDIFLKFTTYQQKAAIVLPNFDAYGKRFSELAYEHRSHNLIRFFHTKEEGVTWLYS